MQTFPATIEAALRGGHWVGVPEDVAAAVGAKHMLRVRGTLGGAPYRSNLAKMGGRLVLGVHKATLAAAGLETGDEALITIEVDDAPRKRPGLPADGAPISG